MSDGTVTDAHNGSGHYKSLAFDESGTQVAFLSDRRSTTSPCRRSASTIGRRPMPRRRSWSRRRPRACRKARSSPTRPRASREDGQRLLLCDRPPPPPVPAPTPIPNVRRSPRRIPVDLWSYKDPQIQPMQRVRVSRTRTELRAVFHLKTKRSCSWRAPDLPNVNPGARSAARHRHVGSAVSEGSVVGPDLQRRLSGRPEDRHRAARSSNTSVAMPRCPPAAGTCCSATGERCTGSRRTSRPASAST